MFKSRPLLLLATLVAAAAAVGACGARQTAAGEGPRANDTSGGGGANTASSDGARQDIPTGTRVPSPKLLDRRARTAVAPDTLGLVKSAAPPPKSEAEIYRSVAPATVIVRIPGGLGTGVIIDPAGWVLTNHHVIAGGESQDFQTKVTVLLGKISGKSGGMEREKREYEAVVHKADPLRDLALLKIVDPPAKLPAVTLAKDNPVPGQHVVAIGHAGAGMLWAIKVGEISALGKLSEQLATLAQFKEDDSGKKAAESFKKYLDERNLGMVIQTTCNILPGDSGGPLVTDRGELVGVNAFSNRDGKTGGLLSFHIHRSEIASFIKDRPAKPARLVPDPWKDGGGDASYEDVDLDGRVDALLLQGRRPCSYCPRQSAAVFIDADQSSYAGTRSLPSLTEVFEKKNFDAELAYLQLEKDAFVWYDTNDDGRYDVLLVDTGTTGRTSAAYRIKADGDLERDANLASGRVIRPSLMGNAALRPRLARIASAAFPERYLEANTALADSLPEPLGQTGEAVVADLDGDGQRDALRISTAFSTRLVLDVDQNTAKSLPARLSLTTLQPGAFDPEVSIVSQSTHMWVWYDTDDDGRFDLVLHSPGSRLYVAADAFSVDAAGNQTPRPEHVGRKLIRPELLENAGFGARLRSMIDKSLLKLMSAAGDDGLASFPDPIADHRGAGFELLDVEGVGKSVVVVSGQGSDGYLVDLDGASLRGKSTKSADVAKLVKAGKLRTDFAYFQRNGLAWAFYDSDGKKGFDLVLYTATPRAGKADHGFRVDDKGVVTLDASLKDTPLVSHSLMKRERDKKKLEKLGKQLFGQKALE